MPDCGIEDIVTGVNRDTVHLKTDPDLVFNIIYGGIEYAEDLGFSSHKDFKVSEYLLPDVEDVPYIDVEFGRNGRPFFITDPRDNVGKIINTLNKTVGEGNYGFARGDVGW